MQQWYCQMSLRLYPNCHSLQYMQIMTLLQGSSALESPADLSREKMWWHTCCLRQWSLQWDLEMVLSPLTAHWKMNTITWSPLAGKQ